MNKLLPPRWGEIIKVSVKYLRVFFPQIMLVTVIISTPIVVHFFGIVSVFNPKTGMLFVTATCLSLKTDFDGYLHSICSMFNPSSLDFNGGLHDGNIWKINH